MGASPSLDPLDDEPDRRLEHIPVRRGDEPSAAVGEPAPGVLGKPERNAARVVEAPRLVHEVPQVTYFGVGLFRGCGTPQRSLQPLPTWRGQVAVRAQAIDDPTQILERCAAHFPG